MNLLLDTHFLLWLLAGSPRLDAHPWLADQRPYGISPISLLEIQFLHESGRIQARNPDLTDAIRKDPRFVIDEPPLLSLVAGPAPRLDPRRLRPPALCP